MESRDRAAGGNKGVPEQRNVVRREAQAGASRSSIATSISPSPRSRISGTGDQLQLRRLKKMKLQIKDQINHLEAEIIPDIIA